MNGDTKQIACGRSARCLGSATSLQARSGPRKTGFGSDREPDGRPLDQQAKPPGVGQRLERQFAAIDRAAPWR